MRDLACTPARRARPRHARTRRHWKNPRRPCPGGVHAPSSPAPRPTAPTPTPPSKLLQRYLASEATKIPESSASGGAALEAEVRARTRALELEVARADGASAVARADGASAHTTYHGRRRVRNDGDGLDGAARGVDAAARAVRRARAASARVDKENDAGVSLEVLKLARDVARHIEASSRVLQDATAVLAKFEDPANEKALSRDQVRAFDADGGAETAAPARPGDEDAWTDGSSGALTPRRDAAPCAESDAWTDASDDEPPPPPTPPPED
ncbi:unnamed protein product [Pelagomonas calceolata]|uniref:Uncharacterized protein n=1 Tax=Pelagomonas calceolata TaxID=35677 RepID=A0A8J2SXY5_9STRA|nr:unnamed protein product [Pelagomonas calceolata]